MQDWEKPPPKFVRKKKKTSKIIPYSIVYLAIILILIFLFIPLINWLKLDSFFVIILFLVIFIVAIVGGIVLHVLLISSFFEDKNF